MSFIMSRVVNPRNWKYDRWLRQVKDAGANELAEGLAIRRDIVTLLCYVRDHKVVGTKTTGNMPLAAIREVTAAFVVPPELDTAIGERIYRLRTEYEVWPLYFLHALAQVGELLETPAGSRWRLTPEAEQFLRFGSLDQVLHMLYVWWFRVNWAIALNNPSFGDVIPADLPRVCLDRLLSIPVGRRIESALFLDALAVRTGIVPDSSAEYRDFLEDRVRWEMRTMLIDVAADFGILELEMEANPLPFLKPEVVAFLVTPLGRTLLTALDLLSSKGQFWKHA